MVFRSDPNCSLTCPKHCLHLFYRFECFYLLKLSPSEISLIYLISFLQRLDPNCGLSRPILRLSSAVLYRSPNVVANRKKIDAAICILQFAFGMIWERETYHFTFSPSILSHNVPFYTLFHKKTILVKKF